MPRTRHPARRGFALVASLALLALAAALLVGTLASSSSLTRAARSARARARAEAGAMLAIGEVVAQWNGAFDAMAAGASVHVALPSDSEGDGPPLIRSALVTRLGDHLFLVSVDTRVGVGAAMLARHRTRLVLERLPSDSGAAGPPHPIPRWGAPESF